MTADAARDIRYLYVTDGPENYETPFWTQVPYHPQVISATSIRYQYPHTRATLDDMLTETYRGRPTEVIELTVPHFSQWCDRKPNRGQFQLPAGLIAEKATEAQSTQIIFDPDSEKYVTMLLELKILPIAKRADLNLRTNYHGLVSVTPQESSKTDSASGPSQ
jgi:hypothetical protein